MIRIAVAEDNEKEAAHLISYLKRYEKEKGTTFLVESFQDGLDLIDNYSGLYHIIFLDIQMKWLDGMETARKIREKDSNTVIIFVTNLAQHAADGYDVDAKAFLIKPINYHVLSRQLDKICETMDHTEKEFLLLSNSREMQRIGLRSIYYIESIGHLVHIHTSHSTISVRLPLKYLEEKLDPRRFVKCNNGTIVNLDHLESITGHEALIAGEKLSVSRNKKKALMDAMADYLGGF